jgi:hypothetical protein
MINPNTLNNGRINLTKQVNTQTLFTMYDKIPANQPAGFRESTAGLWTETKLSKLFFSPPNVQIIQNGIRAGVHKMSNGKYIIGQQDHDSLTVIMRSIFLQYAANKPTDIKQQIYELNKMVWDYTIPQLYGEAQGYHKYIHDASTMYKPMDPPILAKNNDKQLVLKPWF